jgi:signal transduction histidine kinase/CheY-like chemotaxis protein
MVSLRPPIARSVRTATPNRREAERIVAIASARSAELTGSAETPASTPPVAPLARVEPHDARLLVEQLRLSFRQAVRMAAPVVAGCIAISYLAWEHAGHAILLAWAACTIAAIVLRAVISWRSLRGGLGERTAVSWSRWLVTMAFVNGLLTGSVAPLAFPSLPVTELAFITMILCCWAAAGIAANASYPKAYLAFAAPLLAGIAIGWTLAGSEIAGLVLVLLVLFFVVLGGFAIDNGRVVAESIRLRFANEELLAQKEQLLGLMRTAFEKAESARLRAEEASRSKSQFLASASHDLRQPLHALSLLTALLNDMTEDAKVREVGRHIDRSVHSLDSLFAALLDLSKLDAGVVTPELHETSLEDLVDRLATEFQPRAQEKGLVFRADVEALWVRSDPILLERILRNLLENAVRYTQAGRIAIHARRAGVDAVISVSDTGVGIPKHEQTRVFDEFYQLQNPGRDRTKGLGLGLSIVRRLATLLGYRVELSSELGRGTVFELTLPGAAVAAPRAAGGAAAGASEVDLNGLAVLIIEDDAEVRTAMTMALHGWGCRPLVAGSLEEARILLSTTGFKPAVILSDLRLAHGASGIDAIQALRAEIGPLPAALVTGDIAAEKLTEVRVAGYPVLHKPVRATDLQRLLGGLVDAAPQ